MYRCGIQGSLPGNVSGICGGLNGTGTGLSLFRCSHAKSRGQATGPFSVAITRSYSFVLVLEQEKNDRRTDILTGKETEILAD